MTSKRQSAKKSSPQAGAHRISKKLAKWYRQNKRRLPWRDSKDPYQIWLSEIMCQQTTVKAVVPYFEKFTAKFPTVQDLANAPLERVLELWAGLGYYRRARNLHKAAVQFARFGFPRTATELQGFSGIGEYTSAAIASMAFGEHAAVIDGNVERVVTRLFLLPGDPGKGQTKKDIRKYATELIQKTDAGQHNQAMMELGSLLCRPGQQAMCLICPVRADCQGFAQGKVESLPAKAPRKKMTARTDRALAVFEADRLLFGKISANQVWGGLLELPRGVVRTSESPVQSTAKIGRERLKNKPQLLSETPIATVKHGVMNETITLEIYAARLKGRIKNSDYESLHWLTEPETKTAALSSAQRKAQKKIWKWFRESQRQNPSRERARRFSEVSDPLENSSLRAKT